MNDNCRHKDCKYLKVCGASRDLTECSMYQAGNLQAGIVSVGPVDRQKSLIPPYGFEAEQKYREIMEKQYPAKKRLTISK